MQGYKGQIKLMVDETCVKHGRWLRLMGFDTEIFINIEDLKSNTDKRILITRNKKLEKMLKGNIVLLPEMPFWKAMSFIVKKLNLEKFIKPFTRCSRCNREVIKVEKEKVKGKVPYHVYEIQDSFHMCPDCGQIYWGGSHYQNFLRDIKSKIGLDI